MAFSRPDNSPKTSTSAVSTLPSLHTLKSACRSPLSLKGKARIQLTRLITITTITNFVINKVNSGARGAYLHRMIASGPVMSLVEAIFGGVIVHLSLNDADCVAPDSSSAWRSARTTIDRTDGRTNERTNERTREEKSFLRPKRRRQRRRRRDGGGCGRRVGLPARPHLPSPLRPSIPPLHTERRTAAFRGREGGRGG